MTPYPKNLIRRIPEVRRRRMLTAIPRKSRRRCTWTIRNTAADRLARMIEAVREVCQ